MSGIEDRDEDADAGRSDRARARVTATMASATSASERHVAPSDQRRDRRRVACRTLRLVVAPRRGRAGPPRAGYTGAKAVRLVHALVWDDPPRGRGRSWGHSPSPGCCARSGPRSPSPGGSVTRPGRASSSASSASHRSRGCGSGCRFTVRTGTPPGRHWCPARSSSRWPPGAPRCGRHLPRAEAREIDVAVRQPRRRDDDRFFVYLVATLVVASPILNSSLQPRAPPARRSSGLRSRSGSGMGGGGFEPP